MHAVSNAFLDVLVYYRQAMSLLGLSINWGVWSKVESTARKNVENQMLLRGIKTIDPEEGLKIFEQLLHTHTAQIGVLPVEWKHFLRQFPDGAHPQFFVAIAREIEEKGKIEQPFNKQIEILTFLTELAPHMRFSSLIDYVKQVVVGTLRLSASDIDIQQPIANMGVDSLMALEMTNRLKKDLHIDVPMVNLIEGVSIIELAKLANQKLFEPVPGEPFHSQSEASFDTAQDRTVLHTPGERVPSEQLYSETIEVHHLSDAEVDELLKKMLSEKDD